MSAEVSAHSRVERQEYKAFTRYPSGSLRELWAISFPLMLSLMSGSLMIFLDRLLLARYSIDALNACVNATVIAAALQFAFLTTAAIAEVFVGQYNGAGEYKKIAQSVWQMIWFSLLTSLLFLPLGFFAGPFFFSDPNYSHLEIEYFKWLMYFGPIFCLAAALSSFYIGRGSVSFVTWVVVIANVINVLLDLLLIFGFEPFIPSLGIAGAAISTGISQTIQCIILFIGFMRRKHRMQFGTSQWTFNKSCFIQCLKIGLPNSIGHTLEILAWAVFLRMMTLAGDEHITVVAICQSIFMLFAFIAEGISKGATAIAANLIGARQWDIVWKLFRSGIKFYFQAFLVLGLILVVDPGPLIDWFMVDSSEISNQSVRNIAISACIWMWVYFLFDGIHWLVIGLLTAAGDTKFVLWVLGLSSWVFAVIPIYYFIVILEHKADIAWLITASYACLSCLIYLWRLKSEKWRLIKITL